jgi:hypothetical protein
MDDPRQLGAGAVSLRGRELFDAEVLDDADAPGQKIRCVRTVNPSAATDPMGWTPIVTEDGIYYPKHGDPALLAYPFDGPARIIDWEPPAGAVPDVLT